MILRLLFWVFLVFGVSWLLGKLGLRPARAPRARAMSSGGRMVRDKVCDTFLPEDRALRLEHDGCSHYFCSPGCRDRFLTEAGAGRERAAG